MGDLLCLNGFHIHPRCSMGQNFTPFKTEWYTMWGITFFWSIYHVMDIWVVSTFLCLVVSAAMTICVQVCVWVPVLESEFKMRSGIIAHPFSCGLFFFQPVNLFKFQWLCLPIGFRRKLITSLYQTSVKGLMWPCNCIHPLYPWKIGSRTPPCSSPSYEMM